jgi:hypothetical protein
MEIIRNPNPEKEFIIRTEPGENAAARLPEALAYLIRLAERRRKELKHD